jgi:osmotically-inducible protein OsmY
MEKFLGGPAGRSAAKKEATMLTTAVKSDQEIKQDVLQELRWDSRVDETEIGVAVKKGVVTLSGTVPSYGKKIAARDAAHRVAGVLDVADEIEVRWEESPGRTDAEIAGAVRLALEWDVFVPHEKIRSTVSNGRVTLEGEVRTLQERDDAERAIRPLEGVKGVHNFLFVIPRAADAREIRKSIENALERRAEREAKNMQILVEDGIVTVDGHVRTWPEKTAILETARHAPGVREVKDHLTIDPWA